MWQIETVCSALTQCIHPHVQIYAQIPDTEVKFTRQNKEESDDDSQPIREVFAISQRPTVLLQGGQALITFEEEKGTHRFQWLCDIIRCIVFSHASVSVILSLHRFGPDWNVSPIWWIAIKCGTDIHGADRMNPNNLIPWLFL